MEGRVESGERSFNLLHGIVVGSLLSRAVTEHCKIRLGY